MIKSANKSLTGKLTRKKSILSPKKTQLLSNKKIQMEIPDMEKLISEKSNLRIRKSRDQLSLKNQLLRKELSTKLKVE